MGTLQWVMTLLVTGIGTLVLVYGTWYFSDDEPGLPSFAGNFVAFAGAMLGLGPRRQPAVALRFLGTHHRVLLPADWS